MIDIVACTDKTFVMPTGVMMYSVCVNNVESDVTFHIVTRCVSSKEKRKLTDTVSQFERKSILFYDVDSLDLSHLPPILDSRITIATYFRLFLSVLLPQHLHKVLYLDGDIIVRQSLASLWETNIENYAVAATPCDNAHNEEYYNRLGYPKEKGYFNAGVMLVNLEYWRSHNILSAFYDFINEQADRIKYADQDILNYTFWNQKKDLPIKYNLQTGHLLPRPTTEDSGFKRELRKAIDDCVILHFTGTNPWYTTCQHPFRSTFFKYRSQTIWKNTPLIEKRPLRLRIKNSLKWCFRKLNLLPAPPLYGKDFIDGLTPID